MHNKTMLPLVQIISNADIGVKNLKFHRSLSFRKPVKRIIQLQVSNVVFKYLRSSMKLVVRN